MTSKKATRLMQSRKTEKDFDKYYYYKKSVQSPENDVKFLRDAYKELKGKKPTTLCEDFCGTFSICCEWVKLNPEHKAIGIDLDPEPVEYGKQNYLSKLKPAQQARIKIFEGDILETDYPKADIIAAMNFSYYLFKKRADLVEYFKSCHARLAKGGILLCDSFGGSQCQEPNEEETEHEEDGFSYFWDQDSFDPVSNHAVFYIHFKRKGEKKREKVWTYDWRMWTLPEIREAMEEAGFKKTHVYWEGTTEDGEGDGDFKRVEKGEDCEAWVAYVAGEK